MDEKQRNQIFEDGYAAGVRETRQQLYASLLSDGWLGDYSEMESLAALQAFSNREKSNGND
jgi:hypothetical protein